MGMHRCAVWVGWGFDVVEGVRNIEHMERWEDNSRWGWAGDVVSRISPTLRADGNGDVHTIYQVSRLMG